MALTPAQQATLKTAIEADATLNALPNTLDGAFEIARLLNEPFNPDFTVWKTNVPLRDVGDNFLGNEIANLTTAETNRLAAFALYSGGGNADGGINPSLMDRRAFFDDVFSGAQGANTRAALAILWRRLATYVEKLFATGTGTDPDPGLLTWEGSIRYQDVYNARNS